MYFCRANDSPIVIIDTYTAICGTYIAITAMTAANDKTITNAKIAVVDFILFYSLALN